MPRQPRLDLPGIPQHVVQRGNDRLPCFFADIDHTCHLDALREIDLKHGAAIHAYVPMTNHGHLIITPDRAGQLACIMQAIGRRYVRYINDRYCPTGTLWEGRCKACLVDSETHLLRCHRHIKLNPVRAGMVAAPQDHRRSSFATNALGEEDRLVRPHPIHVALGTTARESRCAYRALFDQSPHPDELEMIRSTLQRQHALGPDRFRAAIEAQLARRACPANIGRPRKRAGAEAGDR